MVLSMHRASGPSRAGEQLREILVESLTNSLAAAM
jgi:hypothetical protein